MAIDTIENLSVSHPTGSYLTVNPPGLATGTYLFEVFDGKNAEGNHIAVQRLTHSVSGAQYIRTEEGGNYTAWSGVGIGGNALHSLEDGTDLNEIREAGSYYVHAPTNGPDLGHMFLQVVTRDADWAMQLANTQFGGLKWRLYQSGNWDAFWSAPAASGLYYDGSNSGLSAGNVQAAIDEVRALIS